MTALLLAQAVDFAKFLPFAFFGAFAALAWVALEWMSARKPRAEQRLAELSDPNFRRRKGEDRSRSKRSDAMTKVLEKATPAFAKPLAP